MKKNLVTNGN